MRALVTGARGQVGRACVERLVAAGHDVRATDLGPPSYAVGDPVPYVRADLTDPAAASAVVRDVDAVVHTAAIPRPGLDPDHVVFGTNTAATFAVVDAAARSGVARFVHLSSDSICGITWVPDPPAPAYLPIDEQHPERTQDPYALSKQVGELLCDALVRRSTCTAVSIRATWVQTAQTYAANLGPFLADRSLASPMFWSYLDVEDLADLVLLAVESRTPGHERVYAAAADNAGGRDLRAEVHRAHPGLPVGPLDRPDASAISSARAGELFGWHPRRSWRDHLDDQGRPAGRTTPPR